MEGSGESSFSRASRSRSKASSKASTNAGALVSHICCTSSGCVPATRVASLKEPADRDCAKIPPLSPTTARISAKTCGRWEMRATAASWLATRIGTASACTIWVMRTTSVKVSIHCFGILSPRASHSAA